MEWGWRDGINQQVPQLTINVSNSGTLGDTTDSFTFTYPATVAATVGFVFSAQPAEGAKITLEDSSGTSKTFVIDDTTPSNTGAGEIAVDLITEKGGGAQGTASDLVAKINAAGLDMTATLTGTLNKGVLITQGTKGSGGNTSITLVNASDWNAATSHNIPSAFSGGVGGVDKVVNCVSSGGYPLSQTSTDFTIISAGTSTDALTASSICGAINNTNPHVFAFPRIDRVTGAAEARVYWQTDLADGGDVVVKYARTTAGSYPYSLEYNQNGVAVELGPSASSSISAAKGFLTVTDIPTARSQFTLTDSDGTVVTFHADDEISGTTGVPIITNVLYRYNADGAADAKTWNTAASLAHAINSATTLGITAQVEQNGSTILLQHDIGGTVGNGDRHAETGIPGYAKYIFSGKPDEETQVTFQDSDGTSIKFEVDEDNDGVGRASLQITFSGKPDEASTITLTDSDGTAITFEIDDSADGVGSGNVAVTEITENGGGATGTAIDLAAKINGEATLDIVATVPSAGVVLLKQGTGGTNGNTSVTVDDNTHWGSKTDVTFPAAFAGGENGVIALNGISGAGGGGVGMASDLVTKVNAQATLDIVGYNPVGNVAVFLQITTGTAGNTSITHSDSSNWESNTSNTLPTAFSGGAATGDTKITSIDFSGGFDAVFQGGASVRPITADTAFPFGFGDPVNPVEDGTFDYSVAEVDQMDDLSGSYFQSGDAIPEAKKIGGWGDPHNAPVAIGYNSSNVDSLRNPVSDEGGFIIELRGTFGSLFSTNDKYRVRFRAQDGTLYPPTSEGFGYAVAEDLPPASGRLKASGSPEPYEQFPKKAGTVLRFVMPAVPPGVYDAVLYYGVGFGQSTTIPNVVRVMRRALPDTAMRLRTRVSNYLKAGAMSPEALKRSLGGFE